MVLGDETDRGLSRTGDRWIVSAPPGVDAAALQREVDAAASSVEGVPPPAPLPPPFVGASAEPFDRAKELLARPGVDYEVGWQTPVIGQAWAAVRQTIHDEARLYVDALMARQAELDAALVETIDQLRTEVAELRRQLENRR
jgi:hypothetical protein